MYVQENPANVFTEVRADSPMISISTSSGTVNWPGQIISTWNEEALEAIGIFPAVPVEVPEGMVLTNISFTKDEEGIIRQTGELIPVP